MSKKKLNSSAKRAPKKQRAASSRSSEFAKGDRVKVTRAGSFAHGTVGVVDHQADDQVHVMLAGKGALKAFPVADLAAVDDD